MMMTTTTTIRYDTIAKYLAVSFARANIILISHIFKSVIIHNIHCVFGFWSCSFAYFARLISFSHLVSARSDLNGMSLFFYCHVGLCLVLLQKFTFFSWGVKRMMIQMICFVSAEKIIETQTFTFGCHVSFHLCFGPKRNFSNRNDNLLNLRCGNEHYYFALFSIIW